MVLFPVWDDDTLKYDFYMKTSLVSALRKTHSGISYQFEGAFPVDIL